MDWRPTPVSGVSILVLHADEPLPDVPGAGKRTRGGTVLIRMEPGVGYAPHRHVGCEDVLVLRGGYRDVLGEHRAGDHVHYPPGSEHAPIALGGVEMVRVPLDRVAVGRQVDHIGDG